MRENKGNPLTQSVGEVLLQGLKLIEKMDDASFTIGNRGSVGIHFRHCLDFATNFLSGLKIGKIDYSQRERNTEIETNREQAILHLSTFICDLQAIEISDLEKPVMVKIEEISGLMGRPEWAWSSGLRELEFLQSHTIHHFALIAYKLKSLGIEVEDSFGVAPSTLKYWQEEQAKAA
ncbi:MAG TPA: hypothetical protein PKY82_20430 [Pyrinomonadaceae bacterium]|nr:hypothetical protein [Pyrinomonadaceae bacterium]